MRVLVPLPVVLPLAAIRRPLERVLDEAKVCSLMDAIAAAWGKEMAPL